MCHSRRPGDNYYTEAKTTTQILRVEGHTAMYSPRLEGPSGVAHQIATRARKIRTHMMEITTHIMKITTQI